MEALKKLKMNQDKIARRLIKKKLVPLLEKDGFIGIFPDYRRFGDKALHLLAFEFNKYGGSFFLELACVPRGDLEMSWGEVVLEQDLTVAHTNFESRARLQQNGWANSLSDDWFQYQNLSEPEIEKLVSGVGDLLSQVNDWFVDRTVGKNICVT